MFIPLKWVLRNVCAFCGSADASIRFPAHAVIPVRNTAHSKIKRFFFISIFSSEFDCKTDTALKLIYPLINKTGRWSRTPAIISNFAPKQDCNNRNVDCRHHYPIHPVHINIGLLVNFLYVKNVKMHPAYMKTKRDLLSLL